MFWSSGIAQPINSNDDITILGKYLANSIQMNKKIWSKYKHV